ncbi:hypothetical protein XU18_3402 [Perkinsela sp. CCAP 1560/4]|nr:hypothetical protein XU18_3402 [Perkinsela sp. CCAP 1560/4]|eukprot:KNH05583.1 hypothetical protein XU18_3402 [Perkinsela sp. CCAP 1560/4]
MEEHDKQRGKYMRREVASRIVDREPRLKTGYAEIERSLGAPMHNTHTHYKRSEQYRPIQRAWFAFTAVRFNALAAIISIGEWLIEDRYRTYKIGISEKNLSDCTHRSVKKLLSRNDHILWVKPAWRHSDSVCVRLLPSDLGYRRFAL